MAAEVHSLTTNRNVGKAEGLLRALVPRAQCFCYYDLSRECVWSSDGAEDYEIDRFIKDLPDEVVAELGSGDELLRRTLSSGRPRSRFFRVFPCSSPVTAVSRSESRAIS